MRIPNLKRLKTAANGECIKLTKLPTQKSPWFALIAFVIKPYVVTNEAVNIDHKRNMHDFKIAKCYLKSF